MDEQLTKKQRHELAKEEKRKDREKELLIRRMRKFFVWIFAAAIVLFVGFRTWAWVKAPSPEVAGVHIEVKETDWVKGEKQASTTLLEYGDYQCPGCADYNPFVKRLAEEFPDDLKIIYRHFPIPGHKNSVSAAQAAEAAGRQGKFWEMNNLIYERQDDWENDENVKERFVEYARELGLDETKFLSDYDSEEVKNKIESDADGARAIGVNSTPTFLLNGVQIRPRSYDEFKSLVETQIRGYTIE